ncbi:MAG: hypothetical protein IPL15_10385 [Comamonadaceae bacterium]|uniref:hypothetical protein n=1 Tax=Candidatus Skiveiella danica TaxID=3386177 RepID=UPI00390A1D11|nr:hypothetical protein [Comamonadaceae bacterium]
MGWSLTGILGAVGKAVGDTAQDWAKRGIIEDEKIRSEERSTARAKEMADYQEGLAASREERVLALKEKVDLQKRDKDATTVGALEWAATKDPEGPQLKKGTVAFHDWMQSQLSASGEEGLAKNQADMAAKLRDDVRADRQLDVQMANAAASRAQSAASLGAAREDRLAALDLKREEFKVKEDKEYRADLLKLGTLQKKDKASGEDIVDPSGYSVLRNIDGMLQKDREIGDRADRRDVLIEVSTNARNYYNQHAVGKKPVSWEESVRRSYDDWLKRNPKPEVKK